MTTPLPDRSVPMPTAGALSDGSMMRYQSDFHPSLERRSLAFTVTLVLSPTTRTFSARPPSCPSPLRDDTVIVCSVPIDGYACCTFETNTSVFHLWFGFDEMSSPASTTAGKVPPAVWPPVDDENSVRATAPLEWTRTSPAVWEIARSA